MSRFGGRAHLSEMRHSTRALFVAAFAACSPTSSAPDASPADAAAPSFRIAWSVSPFTAAALGKGVAFTDGTRIAVDALGLQRLYAAHGANEVFVRVATELTPSGGGSGDTSFDNALATAALARAAELPLNPELGLWAHYGDSGCQPPPDFTGYAALNQPGPWQTLGIDQMTPVLEAYGAYVAHQLLDAGTRVRIWDLGNEIDFGTAGVAPRGGCSDYAPPDGVDAAIGQMTVADLLKLSLDDALAWLRAHVWPHEAALLAAVARGIRSVDPAARFATHIAISANADFATAFYRAMADGGMSFDELGFSVYLSQSPKASRGADFRATVAAVREQLGRPIFLAEVAYPAGPLAGSYQSWDHALPSYPISPDGQAALLRDLTSWAAASGVSGIRWWAPDLLDPGWAGFAVFERRAGLARSRAALDAIQAGLAAPNADAFHD